MIYSVALAITIAASPCSWDQPGANRYKGEVPTAVHNYVDIPESTRRKLQARMEKHLYDDVAQISSTQISGLYDYTDLRDMHFGDNQLCQTVTRDKWKPNALELGLVYCEDEHCIIVPTVCGNVSRVTRQLKPAAGSAGTAAPTGAESAGGSHAGAAPPGIKVIENLEPIVIDTVEFVLPSLVVQDKSIPIYDQKNNFPIYTPDFSGPGPVIRPVIPAVPEVSNFLAMAAGLVIILVWLKRRK